MKKYAAYIALFSVIISLFSVGFQSFMFERLVYFILIPIFLLAVYNLLFRYFSNKKWKRLSVIVIDFLCLSLFITVIWFSILHQIQEKSILPPDLKTGLMIFAAFVFFIREVSELRLNFTKISVNPAQLFTMSFLGLIILGTLVLMLPGATHTGLSFIDAAFTSTSAVCVTGLIVVDTGTHFTLFGQTVIMVLIQLGGLGIMTFASYFSYFFRGGTTFENQLLLKDMTNAEKVGEVFKTFKKIILITFLIEALGVVLIYFSVENISGWSFSEKLFFSVFHSISGFCNAGFSTLTDSLYTGAFQFNYPLHLIIAFLFIVGGLGFPIVFNLIKYLKYLLVNRLMSLTSKNSGYIPWVLNINSRIVLITSAILTVGGTLLFYVFEYNNTLSGHSGFGKVVTAFFGAVTTRTAGFNTVDTSALSFSTIMIVFLLMWIGASPGSTGGGIKTSTFAVATLNFIGLAKGKERIEVFRREISEITIRRAFAIISLSLLVIGASIFLLATFDPEKNLISIAFESFSAYSTVGLSLGITASLSAPSKIVILVVMFIGRVSMLTILIAIMKKVAFRNYHYPKEDILIN